MKDQDELMKTLASTPLFMTEMPAEGEDNEVLSALQSLIFDGPPEEVATNFKNQGNEAFLDGPRHFKDAIEYYSKGLAVNAPDDKLNAILHVNRAAVNLELGNYRRVLNDCAAALKLDPKNVKALFRSGKALLMLEKLDQARDCVMRGLQIEPKNKALNDILASIDAKKKDIAAKESRSHDRQLKRQQEERMLWDTIKSRGFTVVFTPNGDDETDSDSEERKARPWSRSWSEMHRPTLDAATGKLAFPVLFLYPEFSESDLIASFHEDDAFADHIEAMFGDPAQAPGWDKERAYTPAALELYFETRPDLDSGGGGGASKQLPARRLLKIGQEASLGEVLEHPDFRIVDGFATFFVLSTSSASAAFAKEFRKKYRQKK
ncbi:hypothetical protein DFJ73DRAFT_642951 [Zopfochytrium polystomum]|nr:hypothetical protein DFJ73DRAFT_642951 [Zopfochytrium polystomum]